MEPVFDQTGRVVAWLRGEYLIDPQGCHVAFLRNNWVVSYRGNYLGRLYRAWFRDLTGAAVGFIRGAPAPPQVPITEPSPAPPEPPSAPMRPLVRLPPAAVRPMPIWSRASWDKFLIGTTADDSVAEGDVPPAPAAPKDSSATAKRVRGDGPSAPS